MRWCPSRGLEYERFDVDLRVDRVDARRDALPPAGVRRCVVILNAFAVVARGSDAATGRVENRTARARLRASTTDVPLRVGERQSARVRARGLRAPTLRRACSPDAPCAFHQPAPGCSAQCAERV